MSRDADRQAFREAYHELRRAHCAPADAIATLLPAWVPARASRATVYRWAKDDEDRLHSDHAEPTREAGRKARLVSHPNTELRISTLPLGEMLGEVVFTLQQTMRYAVGPNTAAPRNPNLAMRAANGLAAAIATSVEVHRKLHDATKMESFTASIMAELERADPALAQRVLARLDQLAQEA